MRQLKQKDIATVRLELIEEQHGICPLCEEVINDPVLDHSHKKDEGWVRGTICRLCNLYLSRIENQRSRYHMQDDRKLSIFLNNVVDYINIKTDMIHPTHGKVKKRSKKVSPKLSK